MLLYSDYVFSLYCRRAVLSYHANRGRIARTETVGCVLLAALAGDTVLTPRTAVDCVLLDTTAPPTWNRNQKLLIGRCGLVLPN